MEENKIWWHISPIMQRFLSTRHNWEIDKRLNFPFPHEGDVRITPNYWGIAFRAITSRVYYDILLNKKSCQFFGEKSYQTISRIIEGVRNQNPLRRFLLGINFYRQREDRAQWRIITNSLAMFSHEPMSCPPAEIYVSQLSAYTG